MPAAEASTTGMSRSLRWTIAGLLCAALLAYAVWPLLTAANLLRAARNGDVAAIESHVDFPRLRRSLARQIVAEAVRLHPLQGTERQIAMGAGTAALAAWLDELLTPRIMADMIGGRTVAPPETNAPVDLSLIRTIPLRGFVAIWWHSSFASPMRYETSLPRPDGRDFLIMGMELRGASWRVTRIDLGGDLLEGLARRLVGMASKAAQP